jgi:hypothetical protein
MATKPIITLNTDADYVSMTELAQELLERIGRYTNERAYNEGNPNWQLYLDGIIAGYESVLSAIGYEEEN